MIYVLGQVAALATIGLVVFALGRALVALVPGARALGPSRTLAQWVLGLAGWVVALFVLTALGLLCSISTTTMAGVALLGGGIAWWRDRRVVERAGEMVVEPPVARTSPGSTNIGDALGALAVLALLAPAFLLAIGPTVSWDAEVYHLTLPRLYLEHGGFVEQPMLVYAHWPQAVELLFAAAMALGSYVTAKLVHFGFGLLLLWSLGTAVRRAAGAAAGWLAVLFLLINDVVFFELRVAYVDLAHAFLLLATVLLLSRARDRAAAGDVVGRDAGVLVAGLAAGLLAGVKVTGVAWVAVATLVYLPSLRTGGGSLRGFVLRFGLPVLALWTPWLAKAAIATGNPVYPLAWAWWGGPHWSAAVGEQFSAWQRSIGMGRDLLDYLLLPYRVIVDGGRGYDHFDGRLSPLWLLLVPLALLAARRHATARRLVAVAGVAFVLWAASSQQMRFLIPVLPLVAYGAAVAIGQGLDRLAGRAPLRPLIAGALVAGVALTAATSHARVLVAGFERLALHRATPIETLRAAAVPEVFRWIDERLPPQARLLMLNTNRGFFCPRPYLADSFFEASQIADALAGIPDALALRQHLREGDVTHVLWSDRDWGIAWPASLRGLLANPSLAEPIYRDDTGHSVFRLH